MAEEDDNSVTRNSERGRKEFRHSNRWKSAAALYAAISFLLLGTVALFGLALEKHRNVLTALSQMERESNLYVETAENLHLQARQFLTSGNAKHLENYSHLLTDRLYREDLLKNSSGVSQGQLAKASRLLNDCIASQSVALKIGVRGQKQKMPLSLSHVTLTSRDENLTGTAAVKRARGILSTAGYDSKHDEFGNEVRLFKQQVASRNSREAEKSGILVFIAFTILGILAVVIPGILMFEVLRRRVVETQLAGIVYLGEALSVTNSLEESARQIMEAADQLIGWDSASLDLYDETTDKLRNILSFEMVDGTRISNRVADLITPSSTIRKAMQEGPQLVNRQSEPVFSRLTGNVMEKHRLSACLMYVPLYHGDKCIGVLSIHSARRNLYSQRDLDLLQHLAQKYAGALERARLFEAVRRSEERSRLVLESSLEGIMLIRQGIILYSNSSIARTFGYENSEAVQGTSVFDLVAPESYAELEKRLQDLDEFKEPVDPFLLTTIRADGSEFAAEVSGTTVEYDDGRAHLMSLRDVSERERTAREIRRVHDVYRRAIEAEGAVPYILRYHDLRYEFPGAGIMELTGYSEEELNTGVFVSRIRDVHFYGGLGELTSAKRWEMMLAGDISSVRCDILFKKRSGEMVWLSDTSVSERDEQGHIIGSFGILEDVTERKLNEIRAQAFASLGEELNSADTPREAARVIAKTADRLFGWDSGVLALYDPETDRMTGIFSQDVIDGNRVDVFSELKNDTPGPRLRKIIDGHGDLILRSPDDGSFDQLTCFGNEARRSASLMFAPIRNRERRIGYVTFQSYTYNAYTEATLADLVSLAEHCASGLEKANLYMALQQNEEQFRTVWVSAASGMRLTDCDGIIRLVNPAFCELVGMQADELEGKTFDVVYHADSRGEVVKKHRERFSKGTIPPKLERTLKLWNGKTVLFEVSNTYVRTSSGTMILCVFRDLTSERALQESLRQKAEELERLAITDSLTGLLNRREFMRRANIEVFRAERYSTKMAILMIDLDHFKDVNDTHGHVVGDLVLTRFGEILRELSRIPDILGRYGGEEFCICAPQTDSEGSRFFAERVCTRLNKEVFAGSAGQTFAISCSIGVADFRQDCNDITSLLLRADKALYKAKENGRNRVEV